MSPKTPKPPIKTSWLRELNNRVDRVLDETRLRRERTKDRSKNASNEEDARRGSKPKS